jgi:hypothetical protein
MGLDDLLKQFDWQQLAFFTLFALPGFVSLQVSRLIFPTAERSFMDQLPEAIGFGVLNAMVAAPFVLLLAPANPWALYLLLIVSLVGLPATWPFIVRFALRKLYLWDLILNPSQNGWDDAFSRRERYFVIIHLKDDRKIGGYYGLDSYAGLHPASGHLYLETLWQLDEDGAFVSPIEGSRGIILRPEDYEFVELLGVTT